MVNVHAEVWLQPWDIIPLIPVVRGMEGVLSGIAGGDPIAEESVMIAHRAVHAAVLSYINPESSQ